jgi:hypothetical protein
MHLSFQEYFAACYLQERLVAQRLTGGEPLPGCAPDELAQYANAEVWHETLIFRFELGASQVGWSSLLLKTLDGNQLQRLAEYDKSERQTALLLATLVIDPHAGFSAADRQRSEQACASWRLVDHVMKSDPFELNPVNTMWRQLLAAEEPQKSAILGRIADAVLASGATRLDLSVARR